MININRYKILIVDDSPSYIRAFGEEFRNEYDIHISTNGETALKVAEENMPDLILLDLKMQKMSGLEICAKLKDNPITKNIPIIFLAESLKDEEDVIKGLEIGGSDYIIKPFNLPILKARIKTHIDLKIKTEMIENLAYRDTLTSLYNRRKFEEMLEVEWKRAMRIKHPLSLLMLDIDNFKSYNASYGELAGDRCLTMIAKVLLSICRRITDLVSRYEGAKFAIILPHTDLDNAIIMAEKIRMSIKDLKLEHTMVKGVPYITVSIGVVSMIPEINTDYNLFVQLAQKALKEAKATGKNKVVYVKPAKKI
jgi:diguanylate cyclase (GGDEF)-like protein